MLGKSAWAKLKPHQDQHCAEQATQLHVGAFITRCYGVTVICLPE